MRKSEEQIKKEIQEIFGFPTEIIERAIQTGVWQVYFRIKGISYYGSITDIGNKPKIQTVDEEIWKWFHYQKKQGESNRS